LALEFSPASLSRMGTGSGWEWETSSCVSSLFPASDSETESAKLSPALVKSLAMGLVSISSACVFDVFVPELALAQESF